MTSLFVAHRYCAPGMYRRFLHPLVIQFGTGYTSTDHCIAYAPPVRKYVAPGVNLGLPEYAESWDGRPWDGSMWRSCPFQTPIGSWLVSTSFHNPSGGLPAVTGVWKTFYEPRFGWRTRRAEENKPYATCAITSGTVTGTADITCVQGFLS